MMVRARVISDRPDSTMSEMPGSESRGTRDHTQLELTFTYDDALLTATGAGLAVLGVFWASLPPSRGRGTYAGARPYSDAPPRRPNGDRSLTSQVLASKHALHYNSS